MCKSVHLSRRQLAFVRLSLSLSLEVRSVPSTAEIVSSTRRQYNLEQKCHGYSAEVVLCSLNPCLPLRLQEGIPQNALLGFTVNSLWWAWMSRVKCSHYLRLPFLKISRHTRLNLLNGSLRFALEGVDINTQPYAIFSGMANRSWRGRSYLVLVNDEVRAARGNGACGVLCIIDACRAANIDQFCNRRAVLKRNGTCLLLYRGEKEQTDCV